jgi:hypothetical protein
MRVPPTAVEQTGTAADYSLAYSTTTNLSAVPAFANATKNLAVTNLTVASGLTANSVSSARATSADAFLGWSAEL